MAVFQINQNFDRVKKNRANGATGYVEKRGEREKVGVDTDEEGGEKDAGKRCR